MITFDNLEFDLGTITIGQNKSVVVNIVNNGSVLTTLKVRNSSCSCTSGQLSHSTLQPDSKGTFTIGFDSTRAGKGSHVKSIELEYKTNNQNFSQIFRIKANVV